VLTSKSIPQRLLLTLGFALVMLAPARAADPAVVVVTSERSVSYLDAAEAMVAELERSGLPRAEVQILSASEFTTAGAPMPRLYVAIGTAASSLMAGRDNRVPLIATLLPRSSFEQIVQTTGRKPSAQFSAVYLSQPLTRQLDLIRLALPDARRVGMLLGPDSQAQAATVQAAAQSRNLQLVTTRVGQGESTFPALQKILEESDVLWAMADPQLYNSSSIQNILLTSFRARVPFMGFSPAYVQAGAVFSVHSTPAMIGRQTAVLVRNVLQGKPLPLMPQYPQEFLVGVNEQVARSLGLTLDGAALTERLRQAERIP